MIIDDEVLAIIIALITVASVFAAVNMLVPRTIEPFSSIGLLNEECRIGGYPSEAVVGGSLRFCILVSNHMGRPMYYKVVFKIGGNETLPTNTTPSPMPPLAEWRMVIDDGMNETRIVEAPINPPESITGDHIALIFELWYYDTSLHEWRYSGVWTHHYVKITVPEGG